MPHFKVGGGVHWRGFGPMAPPLDLLSHNQAGARGSYQGLDHFSPLVQGRRVLVRSDNTTVVAYINWQARGNPLLPLVATVVH